MYRNDFISLGSVPCSENCVQVNKKVDYSTAMHREVIRYKKMLLNRFINFRYIKFDIDVCYHEFGQYMDVIVRYDNTNSKSEKQALYIESHLPSKWDDIKVFDFKEIINKKRGKCLDGLYNS